MTSGMAGLRERGRDLAMLALPAVAWSVHFGLTYGTASVWCGMAEHRDVGLGPVRALVLLYTVLALVTIIWIGVVGWSRHSLEDEPPPHDADSVEDRHRFLGLATGLLAALAAVAVVFEASAALFVTTCQ